MRQRHLLFGIVLAALVTDAQASRAAGDLTITYQITGGSVVGDPDTVILPGQFKITVPADGINTPLTGPALLKTLSVNLSATYFNSYTYMGSPYYGSFQTYAQLPFAMDVAALGMGAGGINNQASFLIQGTQTVHCLGSATYCSYTGYSASVPVALPFSIAVPVSGFAFGPLTGPGPQSGAVQGAVFTQTVSGGTFSGSVTVNFVGMEIDREFVPEPAAGGWAALATLAAIGGATRWRRSRSPS